MFGHKINTPNRAVTATTAEKKKKKKKTLCHFCYMTKKKGSMKNETAQKTKERCEIIVFQMTKKKSESNIHDC